jgi:hypothetical protein
LGRSSSFFCLAFAASIFLPCNAALAQWQINNITPLQELTPYPGGPAPKMSVSRLLREGNLKEYIATAPQFILLGSTKHTLSDLTLLASEGFLDALSQGGVRNLFLEIPRGQQNVLDGQAPVSRVRFSNLPSSEVQAAAQRALEWLIDRAGAKGIKLIAYDFNTWSGTEIADDILNDALRCYAHRNNALQPEDQFTILALHAERLAHDPEAGAFIKSKAGTAKSLIFGGAEHTARKDGLAFALGRDKSAVIHLTSGLQAYSDFVDGLELLNLSLPQTLFDEAPDGLLTLDDGMVKPLSAAAVSRIHALRPGTWRARMCPRILASLGG